MAKTEPAAATLLKGARSTIIERIERETRAASLNNFTEALASRPFLMKVGTKARINALATFALIKALPDKPTPAEALAVIDPLYQLSNSNLTEWLDQDYAITLKLQLSDLITDILSSI